MKQPKEKSARMPIRTRQPGPVAPPGFDQLRRPADLDSVDTVADILNLPLSAGTAQQEPGESPGGDTAPGISPAPGSISAQGTSSTPANETAKGSSTAPGIASAQGSIIAEGGKAAPGSVNAQGGLSTEGTPPAPSTHTAQGRKTAHRKRVVASGGADTIAPARDFTRVPNSVVRTALGRGIFRGKSKAIYDFLYSKTRGAVVPRKSAQLTRAEIMEGAHIGSTHTLRDNLRHLRDVGLVDWAERAGEQDGNEYSVFFPEEANLPFDRDWNPVQVTSPDHPGQSGQNLPRPPSAETAQGAQGLTTAESTASGGPNTFSKDVLKTDDDEAFAGLFERLRQTAREVTGREPSAAENERWREVAELLADELRAAAGRASVVSSAPALLAEHLRRRLTKPQPPALARQTPPAEPPPPQPTQPPTDDELVSMFVTFLHDGMTEADLDERLSGSVEPERWPRIRAAVLTRYERERVQIARPDDTPLDGV